MSYNTVYGNDLYEGSLFVFLNIKVLTKQRIFMLGIAQKPKQGFQAI